MASLSTKVKLYCTANSKTADFGPGGNVALQDDSDGNGPYIKTWSVDGLDKPTDAILANYDTAGNTEETNNTVKSTRKALMVILAINWMRYLKISTRGKHVSKGSKMQTLSRKGVKIE